MKTNYKFAYILRLDDVHISECGIRFYEGDIVTEDVFDEIKGVTKSVTRYKMMNRLAGKELKHLKGKRRKEFLTDDLVIYNTSDFGIISTDDELRVFLNGELRKDPKRPPEDTQNTLDITKVK